MKISQIRAELFYEDGLTYTYDIATSMFSNFCEAAYKLKEGDFGRRKAHKCEINVNCEDTGIEDVDSTNLA
jgi:hypothetical protein